MVPLAASFSVTFAFTRWGLPTEDQVAAGTPNVFQLTTLPNVSYISNTLKLGKNY